MEIKLEEMCWTCRGIGKVKNKKCESCNGLGVRPTVFGQEILDFVKKHLGTGNNQEGE